MDVEIKFWILVRDLRQHCVAVVVMVTALCFLCPARQFIDSRSDRRFVGAQRAPCYECEMFKEEHPESHPYKEIRSRCSYPCGDCGAKPQCAPGVPIVLDGCGCCFICARQIGNICDALNPCDPSKPIDCIYSSPVAITGICIERKGSPCIVNNETYSDGQSFNLDCRTQCICQNGSYGCASLCPQESIEPSFQCHNSRLVSIEGKCCREWMCDHENFTSTSISTTIASTTIALISQVETNTSTLTNVSSEVPKVIAIEKMAPQDNASSPRQLEKDCGRYTSDWSPCSLTCGVGVSLRLTNDNPDCEKRSETRLCNIRPCTDDEQYYSNTIWHHIRNGHVCKATVHAPSPTVIRYENCSSIYQHRVKYCGFCGTLPCCEPLYTTTASVQFYCWEADNGEGAARSSSSGSNSREEATLLSGEKDSFAIRTFPVMQIQSCRCSDSCLEGWKFVRHEHNRFFRHRFAIENKDQSLQTSTNSGK